MATFFQSRPRLALLAFLAIASFYLITEHTAHVFGLLPYALLLLCPLLHVFMHGGHGEHGGHGGQGDHGERAEHGPGLAHNGYVAPADYTAHAGDAVHPPDSAHTSGRWIGGRVGNVDGNGGAS